MSTVLVHIGVRATDLEKTIRFWRDGLGLPVVSTHGSCYDLSDGHHNFRVFPAQRPGPPGPRQRDARLPPHRRAGARPRRDRPPPIGHGL